MKSTPTEAPPFRDHFQQSFWELQASLQKLLISVSANPETPQDTARLLGINKNLSWKVTKVIQADQPLASLGHVPGQGALEILLRAADKKGAPPDVLDSVREAAGEFEKMVQLHCDDRATLELMVDSLGTQGSKGGALEHSRKLAFQGNSGIWGIQSQVMHTTCFLAPNAEDPSLMDQVLLGGMIGMRRLRPDATWPLFRQHDVRDDGSRIESVPQEAIDPEGSDGSEIPFMREFCTGAVPELRESSFERGRVFEFEPGPVGNAGVFSFLTGSIRRGYTSRYTDPVDRYFELASWLSLPIETLLIDVFVDDRLNLFQAPELSLVGRMHGDGGLQRSQREASRLPTSESPRELALGLQGISTPRIPNYGAMVDRVFTRTGWDRRRFRGQRAILKHPPIPAVALLSTRLEDAPKDS